MNELQQLFTAINQLWGLIKKYNETLPELEQTTKFLDEAEHIEFENELVTELFEEWVVRYMKYIERRGI